MYTLENDFILITVGPDGRLLQLRNKQTGKGNIIMRPAPLFRAVLHTGENWEDVATIQQAELTFAQQPDQLIIRAANLRTHMGVHDIAITLTITLLGEKLRFDATIENRSESTVNDFIYPCVGGIETFGNGRPGVLLPQGFGEFHTNIADELNNLDSWDGEHEIVIPYPYTLSMQWMTLTDGEHCLYLTGHDSLFHASAMRLVGGPVDDVTLEMNKMAFVKPGETWVCPEYIAWLYKGPWQQGADEYSAWAQQWRKQVPQKPWMRDMNGYFLVINRQQFGDVAWDYSTLPQLYDLAQAHGCDTVGLFGWYDSGHDNQYPDLKVSETMGGEAQLKEGIRAIQEKGGHVTMYYQGHLMDVGSEYYQSRGKDLEGKTRWGTPYYEEFSKFLQSDFLRCYSKKIFSTICPACTEWHEKMADRADWIRSFGADGVLFDQIGGMPPYPCFDERHGHAKPSLSYSEGRLKLLDAIRQSVDKYGEGYAFMAETLTDVYSQRMDCIHGNNSKTGAHAERALYLQTGATTIINFPEMFRHCFPDNISTLRNPRPYLDPRMANYALCYGFRFEVEARYQKDKDFLLGDCRPQWKEYAQAVAALRRKHADLLLHGRYACDAEIQRLNPGMHNGRFTNGKKQCLVVWNDSLTGLPLKLGSFKPKRWATPLREGTGAPADLSAGEVVVLFKD